MAKTGSISITYKQDITKNQTIITVKGIIKTSGDSYRGDHRTGTYTIKLGSKTIKSGSFTSGCDKNKTTTLFTATVTVTHNADGSYGTVTASYNYDPSDWDLDVSASKSIPTIPRSTTPTFSLNEVELGNPVTINLPRASTSFTHTVEYSIGSKSEVVGSSLETSIDWTPSIELANQIPNSTNGDVTIKCTTYNGTTVIGTTNTVFKLKVPENIVPTFSDITHSENSTNVLNAYEVYVQNRSKLAITILGAEGSYGSTIKSYLIEVDNQKINDKSGITGFITQSGTLTIKGTVTDSRGRSCIKTQDIYVYPYATPYFNNIDIIREDTAVVVTATGSCSSILVNEVQKNELKYRILIKEKNSDEWTDTGVVSTGVIGYALQGRIEGLEPNVSYEVKLYAGDKITESGAYDLAVSTAIVYLDKDVKNGRLGLGKMLEYDDSFLEVPQGKKAYFGEYHKLLDNLLEIVEDDTNVEGYILKYKDKEIKVPTYDEYIELLPKEESSTYIVEGLPVGGHISSSKSQCIFGIQTKTDITKYKNVTVNSCCLNIRSPSGGYLGGSTSYISTGYEYANKSNFSVAAVIKKGDVVRISITTDSTFGDVNNISCNVDIVHLELEFN